MANYMAFQVVIYSFWDVIPYDLLGGRISILFEIRDMAEGGRSVSPSEPGASTSRSIEVCRKSLPVSCPDCYLNFTEWIMFITCILID